MVQLSVAAKSTMVESAVTIAIVIIIIIITTTGIFMASVRQPCENRHTPSAAASDCKTLSLHQFSNGEAVRKNRGVTIELQMARVLVGHHSPAVTSFVLERKTSRTVDRGR